MKHILILALLLASLVFTTNANAQFWQQTNGPGGTDIKSVAVNSQGHIFVLSNSLMRSTDDGNSWHQIGTAILNYSIVKFVIKPTGELFALSFDSTFAKIWRSMDNGDSWVLINRVVADANVYWSLSTTPDGSIFAVLTNNYPISNIFIRSIDNGNTWSNLTPNVVGTIMNIWGNKAGTLFLSTDQFFYRSNDNGQNWSKIVNGITTDVSCFAEMSNGDLYAIADVSYPNKNILFKSIDGGRVWFLDSINIPNINFYFSGISQIFITLKGRIVIDGMGNEPILISDDSGKNWHQYYLRNLFFPNPESSILLAVSNSGTFYFSYAATLLSSPLDSIVNWKHVDVPNGSVNAVIAFPKGNLIAMSNYQWFSSDAGKHWSAQGGGGVEFALDSSLNLLAGAGGRVIRSTDGGATWQAGSGALTSGLVTAIDVRNKGEIFVSSSLEGVFRSTDNGKTWDQLVLGITNQNIFSLAVHQNGDMYAGSQNIIYKSTDVGLTWNTLTTNFPAKAGNVTAMVVNTQGNIIAGVDNAGVFWSTDNGTTWTQKALGLQATKINALVSTPSGKVFAGTDSGIFFLDITPGANWLKFNQGLTATNVLSLCRDQSGRIYAGTDVSGVFSSINTFNIAHPNGSVAATTLVAPANGSTAAAGNLKLVWNAVPKATTYQVSISKTSDFSTVEILSDYLSDTTFSYNVHDIGVTYFWHVQAVGDEGGSLYSDDWSFITSSKAGVNNSNPFTTSLGTNYPNPFSTSTIIPFTIGERSYVKLEILDPLGKSYSILANGNYNPGNYEVKYNGENLSAGTYFIRLQTEKQSFTKILEIVK